ncbi:MAG TPA: nitrogenase component 1 [Methylomusa anaerophila]|uniref:Nitrogenase iron-iron protein beta chain n=1 Tax=Methylomusa anaerophila TaxID=1930071 RepID=A0A348AQQ1_9FIRM|nr:nitrogenase component 1 [Methylomusa anaerophila]BBB93399.1 nitrogenase iron-iron protein beta chain [Methylomusa anaerophila]HML90347.1 nitrogenase component 1 [Methylomusa anaerophila]
MNDRSFIERPRYTCALGGAMATVTALPQGIPIVHAPPGCAGNFAWTQAGGCGLQVGGYCGGLSMPGSNVQEREVVFGGADRLEEEIKNTLDIMQGDIYVVLTSCVTEVIGDDVGAVVRPLQEGGTPIIFAETGGFRGNSYEGYDQVLKSVLRDFAPKTDHKQPGLVNLWGVTPNIDPFWRGNLTAIRTLLEKLGLTVNSFFTDRDSIDEIRRAGSAELNIVVSDVFGQGAAEMGQQIHGTPFIASPLPIGPTATDSFLRHVGGALKIDSPLVEELIYKENQRYYKLLEPLTDCFNDMDLQRYVVVIGDANYTIGITRFLSEDLGWLPEVAAITDILDECQQERLAGRLTALESGLTPKLIFHTDGGEIRRQVVEHWAQRRSETGKYIHSLSPAFVVGSSLDRELAKDLGAAHLSVSFPVANRAVINRGYTGYDGGLTLIEDLISSIITGR